MTVFGFLATIVICGTAVALTWLFSKHPITFRIERTDEVVQTVKAQNEPKEIVEKKQTPEKEVEVVGMDAAIANANALMGIEVEGDINGRKE